MVGAAPIAGLVVRVMEALEQGAGPSRSLMTLGCRRMTIGWAASHHAIPGRWPKSCFVTS